jgi:hypothetical protein
LQEKFQRPPSETLDLRPAEAQDLRVEEETVMTQVSKAGRNEACPCGSGKKYKKCHGLKESSSKGNTVMLVVVGLLMAAGVVAGITSFTSDRAHTGAPGGVWSAEHGHYH